MSSNRDGFLVRHILVSKKRGGFALSALFLIQQEHKKAALRYSADVRAVKVAQEPERVASLLRSHHGASWAMLESSPEVRLAKSQRLEAAGSRLKEIYEKSPSVEMAQRCWQASRGELPREATFFYREMNRLKGVQKPQGPDGQI